MRRQVPSQIADSSESISAQVAWAVHLHQQIHVYLRTGQVSFQVLGAAVAAALVATSQRPAIFPYVLIALPYAAGLAGMVWAQAMREIETCAGIVASHESNIRNEAGRWILFHESAFSHSRPGVFANIASESLMIMLALAAAAVSIWTGFSHTQLIPLGWAIANVFGISILYATVFISRNDAVKARSRVESLINNFIEHAGGQ